MEGPYKATGPLHPTTEQLIDAGTLAADRTGTLVLLHTNDIHDILKAPAHQLGGLAYVAGYVHAMRVKRPDTLFVDAGDIQEKGDEMGPRSKGEASYQVLGAIGLDATVPGNHDFVYGLDRLLRNTQLFHVPIICAGMIYDDTKQSVLPETMTKQIGAVTVGLIGATVERSAHSPARPVTQFDAEALGRRITVLATALAARVDLTVLIIHNGTWAAKAMAKAAPALNVVVCGHTNEITEKPMKAETGALIVTVGRAGQWVGTLDLVVDRDRRKSAATLYEMVPMDHAKITPDPAVAQLIDTLDRKWTPAAAAPAPNKG